MLPGGLALNNLQADQFKFVGFFIGLILTIWLIRFHDSLAPWDLIATVQMITLFYITWIQ